MLLPLKVLGLGLALCTMIVAGGLCELIAALLRVVRACMVVAVAPLLTLALLLVVCVRVARGATYEQFLDEFRQLRQQTVQERRLREIRRAFDGVLRTEDSATSFAEEMQLM